MLVSVGSPPVAAAMNLPDCVFCRIIQQRNSGAAFEPYVSGATCVDQW